MRIHRNPTSIHSPVAGYVHQIELVNQKRQLILSGQIGMRIDGTIAEDIDDQFKIALENIVENLKAANMTKENINKMTIYLAEKMDPQKRKEKLEAALGDYKPCMTLLYVQALANPKIKVEIDASASSD